MSFLFSKTKKDSICTEIEWEKNNIGKVISKDSALASQVGIDLHIKAVTREMLKTLKGNFQYDG